MIYSKLQSIINEKDNMTPFGLSQETGLPRTFIQSLYDNTFQTLNTNHLNKLCQFLRISLSDLLVYYPIDLTVTVSNDKKNILATIETNNQLTDIFTFNVIKRENVLYISISDKDYDRWVAYVKSIETTCFFHIVELITNTFKKNNKNKRANVIFDLSSTLFN